MSTALTGSATHAGQEQVRYSRLARVFHWLIAALILFQLVVGYLVFTDIADASENQRRQLFAAIQTHKSIGFLVLFLSVLRLAWRFWRPPPMPVASPAWQRAIAGFVHTLLYVLMIGLPLTGWAMVSSSPAYSGLPTQFFGVVIIPHMPIVQDLGVLANTAFEDAHKTLALAMAGLLAAHIIAALKHHWIDRDGVMARMALWAGSGVSQDATGHGAGWIGKAMAIALIGGLLASCVFIYSYNFTAKLDYLEPASNMQAAAAKWRVLPDQSAISATGNNNMGAFTVVFKNWSAQIAFDPDKLDDSRIKVFISTASLNADDSYIDGALNGVYYFNTAAFPKAVFEADRFEQGAKPGLFIAHGRLSMIGVTHPVALAFRLTIDDDLATAIGEASIMRAPYKLGPPHDVEPGIDAVIIVKVKVVAQKESSAP